MYISGGKFLKTSLAAFGGWFFWQEAKNFDQGGVNRGPGPGVGGILAPTGWGGVLLTGYHRGVSMYACDHF